MAIELYPKFQESETYQAYEKENVFKCDSSSISQVIEYIKNNPNCNFKVDSEKDKKDWRRGNVDKFIYDLSCARVYYGRMECNY